MKTTLIAFATLVVAAFQAFAQTGNGAPSGPHYNLNIIGKAQCPTDPMTTGNGGVIFVLLNGGTLPNGQPADSISKVNKIYLTPSPDNSTFAVLDGNACDGNGALFELPNPSAGYTIWARALAKPGGTATMTTCATDPTTGDIVCSTLNVLLTRKTGSSKFQPVTSQLTTLCYIDATGATVCAPIFSDTFQNYFWNYDNQGLRLAQLRFYPVP
jgi:hypothetical protein